MGLITSPDKTVLTLVCVSRNDSSNDFKSYFVLVVPKKNTGQQNREVKLR